MAENNTDFAHGGAVAPNLQENLAKASQHLPQQQDEYAESYMVKLSNFEGPLDLLLYLIKEAKIDIKDIFISKVTDQYLMYMQNIDELDLEKASEFLSTAATLLEIKSNSLLPKIEYIEDTEDPAKKMIRQLEEYKMLKEGGEKLKEREMLNRFYKVPDDSVYNVKVVLKDMSLDGLLDAFSKLLTRVSQKEHDVSQPKEIVRDLYTVEDKIVHIREVMQERKQIYFSQLFERDSCRSEIISTFQALLELIRWQFVWVEQPGIYREITLNLVEEQSEMPEDMQLG